MPRSIDVSGGYTPLPSSAADSDPRNAAGTSSLAGRAQRAASAPIHRAPGNSLTRFIRSVFRKIASVFPGTSRLSSPEESESLLGDRSEVKTAAIAQLHAVPDKALENLAQQMKHNFTTLQQAREMRVARRYNESDLDAISFDARVRGELIARGNARIDADVDHVLTDIAKRSRHEPAAPLAVLTHNAFINAQATLLSLRSQGHVSLGENAHTATALFVAAGLGRLSSEDRRNVMRTLSVNDLTRIANLDSNTATRSTASVILLAREEAGTRRDQLTAVFGKTANEFIAHGAVSAQITNARDRFTDDLHPLAQSLHALKTFCDARGEPLPRDVETLRAEIADRLRTSFQAGKVDLASLAPIELNSLRAEFGVFGIKLDRDQLQAAAAQRLPTLERDCQQAVSLVLQGVQAGSPETVLRGLKDLEQRFETLRDTRNALLRDLKSAQDMFNLRQTVFSAAIESLDANQRESIRTRLAGNDVVDLREAIYSLGEMASVERQPELGIVLNRMGAYLEELVASATSLTAEPTTAREQSPSRDVQQAFTATFGIRWDANGTAIFND